jgi:dephospho-CoA kinase
MLRVGLTGGIGSGKSTVASQLATLGATVIDADQIAREVVEPGTPALAEIARRFGSDILASDGQLDRAGLGRLVFADSAALRDLEAITHPAIWARTAELMTAAAERGIAVHDMPLLVEKEMTGEYHLVLVVAADEEVRVERLRATRGMSESDARARIAAQSDDAARRRAADVWMENDGSPEALATAVLGLWHERIEPFEENLRRGIRVRRPDHLTLAEPDPTWPEQAERLIARVRHALGDRAVDIEHIGSTSVPGMVAKDVLDLQVGVADLGSADAAEFVGAMAAGGFPRVVEITGDNSKDGTTWPKRMHGSCDPARVVNIHVREHGSPGWAWALGFRDWLRSDEEARTAYAALKLDLLAQGHATESYGRAKEPWFDAVHDRIQPWANRHTVAARTSGPNG